MSFTAIGICSRALVKLGAKSISSLNEGTSEASVAEQLYDTTVEGLLASYPWRFALVQKELTRLKEAPKADYRYAYQLPSDFIRVISAGTIGRGSGLNYRLVRNQLHTDSDRVVLTYICRPEEDIFPPFFNQALISKLASEFCLPLTESTTRADHLRSIADEEIQKARLIDSQQAVPSCFQDFSLIEVRG